MRSIEVGTAFFACLLSACGSSSSAALFGNTDQSSCNSGTTCAPQDTGGAGGTPADGGAGGVGGDSAGGDVGAGGDGAFGGNIGTGGIGNAGGDVGSGGVAGNGSDAGAAGDIGAGGAQQVSCPAGDYHAVLTGAYRSITGTNEVGATIDFSVGDSGAVSGHFVGPGTAKATVTGSVDCTTMALTATIDNGAYQVGLTTARFSGTFDGSYEPDRAGFHGMWLITESGNATYGGNGPWSTPSSPLP